SLRLPHGSTPCHVPPPPVTVVLVRSMISVWRSSATSGSIKSMISYGLILITSCGLDSPGPRVAPRSGGRRRARSRKLLDWGEYSWDGEAGAKAGEVGAMKRLLWLVAGAAGVFAVLTASPETYTRLRERVAGGPVGELMPGDDHDYAPPPPPPPPPPAPEPEAAAEDEDDDDTDEFTLPPPPPPPAP